MRDRAIIIGGSLAGLCAASALAPHFRRITVLERDTLPDGPRMRSGAPQARHVHVLLTRGRRELERLFPGFERRLLESGALELDFGMTFAVLRQHGWQRRQPFGITGLFQSRALLEWVVRDRARGIANLELRERTSVLGLCAAERPARRIRGVLAQSREGAGPEAIDADLVVDASGRASKLASWLTALGVEPPAEEVVDSDSGYATRWYRAPAPERWPAEWWWKGIWIDPELPDSRVAGALSPVENGEWVVTLGGLEGHHPPTDETGFEEFLRGLRSPLLAQALALAEPISPIYGHRAMANRFRLFDRWRARLDGFVALGDAVCAFNPVYGQGMSSAAVSARLLGEWVAAAGPSGEWAPQRFFRAQAHFLRDVWALATGADFRFPKTTGRRPPLVKLANGYIDRLVPAAEDDAVVRETLRDVIHLMAPPAAIFRPSMVARVLRHRFHHGDELSFAPQVLAAPPA